MKVKDKLKEAELIEQTPVQEVPAAQPAPVEDVQEAAPVAVPEEPAPVEEPETNVEIPAEIEIKPQDLAQAVAMVTGDVEPAETAPDLVAKQEEPAPVEDPIDMPMEEQPVQEACEPKAEAFEEACESDAKMAAESAKPEVVRQVADPESEPTGVDKKDYDAKDSPKDGKDPIDKINFTESLTEDEMKMILEYRKMKEAEEAPREVVVEDEKITANAGAPEVDPVEPAPIDAMKEAENLCPECGKNPCECDKPMKEAEEIDSVEDDLGEVNPIDDTTPMEDVIDMTVDTPMDDMPEVDPVNDPMIAALDDDTPVDYNPAEADALDAMLRGVEDEAEDTINMAKDEVRDTADKMQGSVNFLKSLLGEDVIMEDDIAFDDEVEEDEAPIDECIERIPVDLPKKAFTKVPVPEKKVLTPINEAKENLDGVVLPPGCTVVGNDDEDNLVRNYEAQVKAKRESIAKFRESIRAEKNNKFTEALNKTAKVEKVEESENYDPNAWENNRMIEKVEKRQQLNFKELKNLLNSGFLG